MNKAPAGSRRDPEPTYTEGWVHIPSLRKKLKWLYASHPFVNTQTDLAHELHVGGGTLSTWLNGLRPRTDDGSVAVVNPDSIPTKNFRDFVAIWGIPAEVLQIEDVDEFRNAVDTFDAGRGPWEKLVRALPDDDSIEILANVTRAVFNPDDEAEGEAAMVRFRAGDEIMVRVANPGLRHAVMLLEDRHGWSCMRPTSRWKDTEADSVVVFPRQSADGVPRFAPLDTTGGVHRVLVIFTADPLPAAILDILLTRPIDLRSLNHAAGAFHNRLAAGKCRMLSRRFLVTVGEAK
jgi:hypothetical protein